MGKIRFTSKKAPRGNKLERVAGVEEYSSILYKGQTVGCVHGINRLPCSPSQTTLISLSSVRA